MSTRVGSTRTSPITPGPKSLSLHSNLGSSNHHHVQNGKPHPQVEQEALPAVVVEETSDETCPKSVSKEKLSSNSNVPEPSNHFEESTENGTCGAGEATFSSEVISETETLLKSSKLSMPRPKTKKNSHSAIS